MVYIILITVTALVGAYFAYRYLSLLYAFREIIKDLNDIQQDLTRNQILHLPIPDRQMKRLLASFNITLGQIQKERQRYEKREKEFQKQIENISHDLRTPLTVILGYLKLMNQSGKLIEADSGLSETIRIIENKAEVMRNLVTQFYDYSRINAGDYEIRLDHIDLTRALKESLMGSFQILERADLQVSADIPDMPVWVIAEKSALERIFLNLFQNAGRYAKTFLSICLKHNEENVSITFTNDTAILSEEDIPHLFQRFYTQDSSRNQGGTGLGLTVAKTLAEEMGADMQVYMVHEDMSGEKAGIEICFELSMKRAV